MKALVVAAALIGAAPAVAQVDADQVESIEVRIGDLDLTRASDAARLDRRLAMAVRRVCGPPEAASLDAYRAVAVCREEAAARVAPQRDTAIAEARRGHRSRLALATRR